jgi:hypothetical protein
VNEIQLSTEDSCISCSSLSKCFRGLSNPICMARSTVTAGSTAITSDTLSTMVADLVASLGLEGTKGRRLCRLIKLALYVHSVGKTAMIRAGAVYCGRTIHDTRPLSSQRTALHSLMSITLYGIQRHYCCIGRPDFTANSWCSWVVGLLDTILRRTRSSFTQ